VSQLPRPTPSSPASRRAPASPRRMARTGWTRSSTMPSRMIARRDHGRVLNHQAIESRLDPEPRWAARSRFCAEWGLVAEGRFISLRPGAICSSIASGSGPPENHARPALLERSSCAAGKPKREGWRRIPFMEIASKLGVGVRVGKRQSGTPEAILDTIKPRILPTRSHTNRNCSDCDRSIVRL
jgi:hypothetical protein